MPAATARAATDPAQSAAGSGSRSTSTGSSPGGARRHRPGSRCRPSARSGSTSGPCCRARSRPISRPTCRRLPRRRAELSWLGGTFEGADIAGFRVFGSDTARGYGDRRVRSGVFGDVDLGVVLADITAYPSGIMTDGFGFGPFGAGGFGAAAGTYNWTSEPLTRGSWSYAVIPYDSAGNLGDPAVTGVTIVCPPLPPALDANNIRLHYTYDAGTQEATLTWLASPG